MDAREAAIASGDSINGLGTHFMLDLNTYAHGATLGFDGIDFYLAGRCGVLGDAPASVVAAALVFFEPGYVADGWARSASVMPRHQAALEFAGVCHRWADEKVPDDIDATRLAALTGRVADAASVAGAPLFAGWRSLPEPEADRPKALALHRVNALRELRGAMHGAAILTHGVTPHAAVARRTPYMLDVFGWKAPHPDKDPVREPWADAQAATERAMAPAFEALTSAEREELVELVDATQAAVTPPAA
ncbi:MAG: hypothetical protein KDA94_01090 [Acidimicrobiales bacterium]|nr:hypothetical protein [Acidimicrobiales bacterium]